MRGLLPGVALEKPQCLFLWLSPAVGWKKETTCNLSPRKEIAEITRVRRKPAKE